MGRKFGFHSGASHAKVAYEGIQALTSSATIALNAAKANVFTLTPAHTATINGSGIVKTAGQRVNMVITTSGATSYVLTFGTNFKSTGTLTTGTDTAKVFTVSFISDGSNLNEVSRSTAM